MSDIRKALMLSSVAAVLARMVPPPRVEVEVAHTAEAKPKRAKVKAARKQRRRHG